MQSLVRGVVETDALAKAITDRVLHRAAESAVLTAEWLEHDGNPLNEMQKVMLYRAWLQCFEGLAADVQDQLEGGIRRDA